MPSQRAPTAPSSDVEARRSCVGGASMRPKFEKNGEIDVIDFN
jgi:hypothetical protein